VTTFYLFVPEELLQLAVDLNRRLALFIVHDLNIFQIDKYLRAYRLDKRLLCRKPHTRGQIRVHFLETISDFIFREKFLKELHAPFFMGLFHPLNLDEVYADTVDHIAEKFKANIVI